MKRSETPSPIGAIARGLANGGGGHRGELRGSEPSTTAAEVGKRVIRGVFQRSFDEDRTSALNSAMHWAHGTSWGAAYALTDGLGDIPILPRGLGFGTAVWGASLTSCRQ